MTTRRITFLFTLLAVSSTTLLAAQPPEALRGALDWQTFSERHDVDGNGVVTSEELASTAPMISRLDADGNGEISEADFEARRTEMARAMMIHMADADRDGQVGSQEWIALQQALDADGDGAFGIEDLADLRPEKARRGHPGKSDEGSEGRSQDRRAEFHEDLADALDLDGDDQLTSNDLDLLFLELDEDGDGRVEARRPHRTHRRGPKG